MFVSFADAYARALLTGSSSMSMTCGTGRLFSRPRMHFDAHCRDQTAPLYLAALDPVGFRLPPCLHIGLLYKVDSLW